MGALEILAGMVVFALGLWVAAQALSWWWSRDEKRTAALAAQAERLDMDFVATDALHVTWEPFPLFGIGARREARNIVHGTWGGVPIRVFDYSFEQPSDQSSALASPRRRLTCAVAEIDASCPRIVIGPATLASRLGEVVGVMEIRLESEAFNRRYRVETEDARFAATLVDQRMMAWLLESPANVAFELREDRMLCVSERLSPASIPMLLEAARGFHERIPRVVASMYPPRPMGPGERPGRRADPSAIAQLARDRGRWDGGTSGAQPVGWERQAPPEKGTTVPAVWIVLAIVVLIAIGIVVSYNRFVAQRNLIRDSWANIDTELRRRYDLIPNLIETVKGYASHERETFENVTRARAAAASATGSPAEQAAAEGPFVAALRQLFAVAEAYPDLKANQNFLALQQELSNTEDRLQTSRRFYNSNVRDYNERVQSFPSNLIANGFHFEEEEFFEVDEGIREAGPPQVNFTDSSRPSTSPGGDVGSPTGTPPSTGVSPPEAGGPLPPIPPPTGT